MSHVVSVVKLLLAFVDVAEDPGQARPQDHPGVLLLLQDVELQQVADDLPGEEDVDALLQCGSSEVVGGDVLDLVAEVVQAGLETLPAHVDVGVREDHDPLLPPLVQEVLELLQVSQSPVTKILEGLDSVDQPKDGCYLF